MSVIDVSPREVLYDKEKTEGAGGVSLKSVGPDNNS
jgi:hypothetical protein